MTSVSERKQVTSVKQEVERHAMKNSKLLVSLPKIMPTKTICLVPDEYSKEAAMQTFPYIDEFEYTFLHGKELTKLRDSILEQGHNCFYYVKVKPSQYKSPNYCHVPERNRKFLNNP